MSLTPALNYEYRNSNIEGSLIVCLFSTIVVVSFPTINSYPDLQHQVCVSSSGIGFKDSQKVAGCTHNILAIVARIDISCHDSHYCSLQGSQLGKIVDDFSL